MKYILTIHLHLKSVLLCVCYVCVIGDMLRPYLKGGKTKNLIQNLYGKEKYALRYTNFILYL